MMAALIFAVQYARVDVIRSRFNGREYQSLVSANKA